MEKSLFGSAIGDCHRNTGQIGWEFLVWVRTLYYPLHPMVFSTKNAGKWVASKGETVIATSKSLPALMKKVDARKDKAAIRYDRVPRQSYFVGTCGVRVR